MANELSDPPAASIRLLVAGDPDPVVVENPGGLGTFLLLGDHAGRGVPAALGDLGLPPEAFERHIAWDIGVAGVGARLAELLDAPFVRQRYSRLVIDCNRYLGQVGSIAGISDATPIPANQGLDAAARQARENEIFQPYHQTIASLVESALLAGRRPILVAVHSFTPALSDGAPRPWRFGVVHEGNSPFSQAVLSQLRTRHGEAVVGDNLPYAMDGYDYTVPEQAIARGLDYLEIEIRQDTIASEADQRRVAEGLAPVLTAALASLSA